MAGYSSFKKISSDAINAGAITSVKLADSAVTTDKLSSTAVRTTDIQDGAVGTTELATTLNLSTKTVTYRPLVNADFASSAVSGAQLATGAITTNLGYTPVNRANPTLSFNLSVTPSTAATPGIASSGQTNTGINFNATTSTMEIVGGGNVGISFSLNSSRVTHPNKPAFYAAASGGWYYRSSFPAPGWYELIVTNPGQPTQAGWPFTVTQTGGTNFSTIGRFTAPVSGWYYFYAQTYQYNDTSGSDGYSHFGVGKNSGTGTLGFPVNRTAHTIYGYGLQGQGRSPATGNYVPGIMTSATFYMAATDYASMVTYMAASCRFHGSHTLFCGYLIG